ncbi:LacI family DNA-binding transcriptional regulator [Vagococcus sp. PNs007]|uniref:LacI family DNA-binding transcriptional regulator n=1 Tax=Vagococcus proximus TaxID=2991417 RepID=A0ABT5X0N3_9ENTE|nr:LacI family DNA-binding transcriptional regulator [Vagococcus proximus]MDF0479464.1 LacI family DNA-binding transcriptional regulator [Vagococcus proximus]
MATIRDVAKLSGYSVSTVSRVLNNHPYVSEEKRQRIKNAMRELHYIPNNQARMLSSGQSFNVGLMVPNTTNPCFTQIISGCLSEAGKAGYRVTILQTDFDKEKERNYLQQLLSKEYDGLIISSHAVPLSEIETISKQAPIICCENPQDLAISAVYSERHQAYTTLFETLKSEGHELVGLVLSRTEKESPSMGAIVQAYRRTYGDIKNACVYREAMTYEDGLSAGAYFLGKENLPTVIICNDDEVAAGVLNVLAPNNTVLIIGQGNSLVSKIMTLPTINHHYYKIGQETFKKLFSETLDKIELKSELIWR